MRRLAVFLLCFWALEAEASSVKVLFGHQSVGGNILEGMPKSDDVVVVDELIGENEKPLTKIRGFEDFVKANRDARAAMLKFCYIDFNRDTDVPKLFAEYTALHDRLKQAYPTILFAHVTTPLTIVQTGPKAWLKKLTGKDPWGYAENQKRAEWNALLKSHYAGAAPIFDLADLESRNDEGDPVSYAVGTTQIPMLFDGITSDGGHLNDKGKKKLGAAFAKFVQSLVVER